MKIRPERTARATDGAGAYDITSRIQVCAVVNFCQLDLRKFWYDFDGVGPRWFWYFDPTLSLP